MTRGNTDNLENRVLVLMPTGRDGALVCSTLENVGIWAEEIRNEKDLLDKQAAGTGAILIADEALRDDTLELLAETLDCQPVWSDLPVIIFAAGGQRADKLLAKIGARFNATIVDRPIRIALLISAVRSALRARQRQYQARDLLHQLEESDRQKDLFLATLSHELRTPLNSMLGWIQMLRNKQNGMGQVETDYALEVIERNARAQSELISDILFVSRIITGKLKLNFETINLIFVLEAAIDVVRPSIEAKEIRLETHFESAGQIKGDADRLQQIFWNILSNAVKFTPRGGSIHINVRRQGAQTEIKITDDGQGIEAEFLPYIFDRFSQADSTYTRKVGGLGLGLAIVRYLVELHGGAIRVESDGPNRGTCFTLLLPVCAKPQTGEMQPFFGAKSNRADAAKKQYLPLKIRALLVEDNDDSREMMKLMLEHYGIEAIAVESAAQALAEIRQNRPDILISDVGLPGEDGLQLIQKVRLLPDEKGGNIPAIALTGYVSAQDRTHALALGYQEHLAKPVDSEKLIDLVKTFVLKSNPAETNGSRMSRKE
jgi:signal transduction histidine kinase/CheY-like chemotaxis protein